MLLCRVVVAFGCERVPRVWQAGRQAALAVAQSDFDGQSDAIFSETLADDAAITKYVGAMDTIGHACGDDEAHPAVPRCPPVPPRDSPVPPVTPQCPPVPRPLVCGPGVRGSCRTPSISAWFRVQDADEIAEMEGLLLNKAKARGKRTEFEVVDGSEKVRGSSRGLGPLGPLGPLGLLSWLPGVAGPTLRQLTSSRSATSRTSTQTTSRTSWSLRTLCTAAARCCRNSTRRSSTPDS